MIRLLNRTFLLATLLWTSLMPLATAAPAYCALRDPVSTIQELYPESTSYRSSVRSVEAEAQQQIRSHLPAGSLHFSEFGRHTLYIVLKGDEPIGFVHARSEASRWGLVEVAWALDLDLKIRDFRFQRCRSRKRKGLEELSFRSQFMGLNAEEMKSLFDDEAKQLDLSRIEIPKGSESLANTVARCGLKTLLVTEYGWAEDVTQARLNRLKANNAPPG